MNENLKVTTQESSDDSFARALGISPEREQQLDDLMDTYHRETTTYPDAIAMLSKDLTSANELAYSAFHMGAFAESQRSKHELLQRLLEA